eukprot:CAMPEP_0203733732 /NCGR_PEP_ID=MMETSP0092-20131115/28014_1 /ASSEMBLY_ACC=CAM_ASM_001090 /TAXON_ID=426623 /ORGANISM="Chaetoceros affinis, Strain CCMP159" /LENGTH=140 /DNA_ID=CAMNT_0050617701 /DNA_START=236 /DNA_END=655 /DNA_ORIENTATION=+
MNPIDIFAAVFSSSIVSLCSIYSFSSSGKFSNISDGSSSLMEFGDGVGGDDDSSFVVDDGTSTISSSSSSCSSSSSSKSSSSLIFSSLSSCSVLWSFSNLVEISIGALVGLFVMAMDTIGDNVGNAVGDAVGDTVGDNVG